MRLYASTGPLKVELKICMLLRSANQMAENQWKIQKRLRPGSLSDFTRIQETGNVGQPYVSWSSIV